VINLQGANNALCTNGFIIPAKKYQKNRALPCFKATAIHPERRRLLQKGKYRKISFKRSVGAMQPATALREDGQQTLPRSSNASMVILLGSMPCDKQNMPKMWLKDTSLMQTSIILHNLRIG